MKFDVTANDSIRVPELFNGLNRNFFSDPDSTVYFADHIIAIAEKINNDTLWIIAKQMGGEGYRASGKFSRSLKYQLEAIGRSKELKNRRLEAMSSSFLGFTYLQSGFYREGLDYCIPAFKILDSSGQKTSASFTASNAASCFTHLGNADSADIFNDLAWKIWQLTDVADQRRNALRTLIFDRVAANYELKSDYENAIFYYRQSMQFSIKDNIGVNKSMGQKNLARIFLLLNQQDSAKYFALASISKPKLTHQQLYMVESALVLDSIYRREGKLDSALYFQTIAMNVQDSIFGPRKIQELQKLMADEQELHQQRELDRSASRSRQRMLLMVGAVLVLLDYCFYPQKRK
jgi:tetratricopeptide (TPR) repeat protein